jgi:catechol 2,3-dioxygenase-like lactoylglutathione lyase family enzyme
MEPRVSFITLAIADLEAARRFYVDGLGWSAELDVPGEVLMIRVGERLVLSLWAESGFEGEVGPIRRGAGLAPVTLAHNVPPRAAVDAVLETARAAGASMVGVGEERDWGGYTGYFADPDGYRWEVAWNPGPVGLLVVPDTDPAG